jgi:hypothetical protein
MRRVVKRLKAKLRAGAGRSPPGDRHTDAQWILLSAIVAALGLGVIMILLNMAVLNGHSSVLSVTSFPKNDIRDLRKLSISEAVLISGEVNADDTILDRAGAFNSSYGKFVNETARLYQMHSALINITYLPNNMSITLINGNSVSKIVSVNLTIAYSNSDTIYVEKITVGTS